MGIFSENLKLNRKGTTDFVQAELISEQTFPLNTKEGKVRNF